MRNEKLEMEMVVIIASRWYLYQRHSELSESEMAASQSVVSSPDPNPNPR